jgi:hypothetical protein
MTAIPAVAARFDIGRTIRRTFDAIRRNLLLFAFFCAAFCGAPLALAEYAYDHERAAESSRLLAGFTPGYWGGFAAYQVAICIPQAVLAHGVAMYMTGRTARLNECVARALRSFFPLLGIGLLGTLMIALGLVLFIAPGLFLITVWMAAAPAQVVEGTGVLRAFERSRTLTKGYGWHVFLFVLLTFVLIVLLEVAAYAGAFALTDLGWLSVRWDDIVTTFITATVEDLIVITASAAIYFELRGLKEGGSAEDLAAQFD